MCPDCELNRQPFGSQAGSQSTKPYQPGKFSNYLKILPGEKDQDEGEGTRNRVSRKWIIYKGNTNQANGFSSKKAKALLGWINIIMLA